MRLLALLATMAAGWSTLRFVPGSFALHVVVLLLTMSLLQAILLPLVERGLAFRWGTLFLKLAEGVALAAVLYGATRLAAELTGIVLQPYIAGFVWPLVDFWPRRA